MGMRIFRTRSATQRPPPAGAACRRVSRKFPFLFLFLFLFPVLFWGAAEAAAGLDAPGACADVGAAAQPAITAARHNSTMRCVRVSRSICSFTAAASRFMGLRASAEADADAEGEGGRVRACVPIEEFPSSGVAFSP
ncbi:MAG: hypothetical protein JWP87_889 [Labilithrix sp.]|nr:hypothetical protein [Labilithrix sp.]